MRQPDHIVIQGDFLPPEHERLLKTSMRLFAILLVVAITAALIVYGLRVHYETDINRLAHSTRELNEQNKEFQVKLNQLKSYKNVESAAAHAPNLKVPELVITVHSPKQNNTTSNLFPPQPQTTQDFPHVYGY